MSGSRVDRRSTGGSNRGSTGSDDSTPLERTRRRGGRGDRDEASGDHSGSPTDRREIERTLARYVPDDEARARALDAMTTSGHRAREWYNARATETHDLLASLAASRSLSSLSSLSSSSSSSSSSSLSSPSWAHADPLRDVRGAINFCKSVLIGRYVQPRCAVMDLGCGRGQDVAKLAYARPRYVLFVDASESALAEAERRWRRTRFAFPAAFVQDDFCVPDGLLAGRRVVVHRDDPQRAPGQRHHAVPDAECVVPDVAGLVDAISCQFAIQHAFETRATALAFVANVRRVLALVASLWASLPMARVSGNLPVSAHSLNQLLPLQRRRSTAMVPQSVRSPAIPTTATMTRAANATTNNTRAGSCLLHP